MRINIIVRGAGIYPLDSHKILIKAEMNKKEVEKHLYGLMRVSPWAWDYLAKIRERFDDKGYE